MRIAIALALALAACNGDDGPRQQPVDACTSCTDAPVQDAPYTCVPPRLEPPAACLALEPDALRGTTPFGTLDLALQYFGAGDCITISTATIQLVGACGESLHVQFSYPVHVVGDKRAVTESFDATARFLFQPPAAAARDDTGPVHVEVVRWQEGTTMHDVDITLTILDARFSTTPVHIAGTFCDWPSLLC